MNATFVGQRASDGCIPDRVQSDGIAVYSPGGNSPAAAFSDHAWDNMPFAALLLTSATEKFYSSQKSKDFFCALEPAVRTARDLNDVCLPIILTLSSFLVAACLFCFVHPRKLLPAWMCVCCVCVKGQARVGLCESVRWHWACVRCSAYRPVLAMTVNSVHAYIHHSWLWLTDPRPPAST